MLLEEEESDHSFLDYRKRFILVKTFYITFQNKKCVYKTELN